MSQNTVSIKNKRARYDYELLETFEAGLVLGGTEIKSIRQSKARITESFCEFNDKGELFIVNMNIDLTRMVISTIISLPQNENYYYKKKS